MGLTCLVIDDDRVQREMIISYVQETTALSLLNAFESPVDANHFMSTHDVDLIFLDIEMPKMTGFELLKGSINLPHIIIVSSNEQYALQSYEYNVVDFLKKPVSYARFLQAINKVISTASQRNNDMDRMDEIFVKVNSVIEKVKLSEVLFIEAAVDYIKIVMTDKSLLVNTSMNSILKKLPSNDFIRVHRSHIVRMDKIDRIDGLMIEIKDHIIRISKSYKDQVIKRIDVL